MCLDVYSWSKARQFSCTSVVYFVNGCSARHSLVICFCVKTSFFIFFPSLTGKKKEKRKESIKNKEKHAKRKITFFPGVNQLLGVKQRLRVTPKRWYTPFYDMFFCYFLHFPPFSVYDGKTCFSAKKIILTSKRHAKHPFAGRNTQQQYFR